VQAAQHMATATNARVPNVTKVNRRLDRWNGRKKAVSTRLVYAMNARTIARATWNQAQSRAARLAAAAVDAGSKSDAPEPVPEVPLETTVRESLPFVRVGVVQWMDAEGVTDTLLVFVQLQVGVDYTTLRDRLRAGEWEEADNETRRLLIVLAGADAQKRGWVYFTEVKNISVADLGTMDKLWVAYSKGNYGYSVQRKIWLQCKKEWGPFFKKIDWTTGGNNTYRKWPEDFQWRADAAKGHLPLTNALRGTQLITAIFEHPAIAGADGPKAAPKQKKLFNF